MRRTPVVAMGMVLMFVGVACGGGVSGAQKWPVSVDAKSPEGKNFQYSAFFPSTLEASPGDTVVFGNNSSQAPHTITFGVASDRSNQPPVVLPDGTESPVVLRPCFAEDGPTNTLTKCPDTNLPEYDGSGYWNSGFLVPAVAPEGTKRVTLTLSDSIELGSYTYVCVLHAPMAGVLKIVDEGDRKPKKELVEAARAEFVQVRTAAAAIKDPEVGPGVVAAGWSSGVTAVNRFAPATIEVKAGSTVSWEAFSDFEPHTVSLGSYKAGVPDTAPKGPKSGSPYTSGDLSSGVFGKAGGPFPPGPFKLTFPRAGTYTYVCTLHPQMQGTVKVT